jgi:hypothetical protein
VRILKRNSRAVSDAKLQIAGLDRAGCNVQAIASGIFAQDGVANGSRRWFSKRHTATNILSNRHVGE